MIVIFSLCLECFRGAYIVVREQLHSLTMTCSWGAYSVLIKAADGSFLGFVTDAAALSYLASIAETSPSLQHFLTNPLEALTLPSLYLFTSVVAAPATSSVLDAMRLMSEEGVSSIAVLNEEGGSLLSAVSVTDIGKVKNTSIIIKHYIDLLNSV
jgi:CBS domain-containing protein